MIQIVYSGMPVLEVWKSRRHNLEARQGYRLFGYRNPLFYKENSRMLYGDAKKSVDELLTKLADFLKIVLAPPSFFFVEQNCIILTLFLNQSLEVQTPLVSASKIVSHFSPSIVYHQLPKPHSCASLIRLVHKKHPCTFLGYVAPKRCPL